MDIALYFSQKFRDIRLYEIEFTIFSQINSTFAFQAVNNQIPKNIVLRNSVRGMSEFSNEDEFLKSTNMDTERKGKEKCKYHFKKVNIFGT